MYNNFEISLVVFMPNITTNHAITYTNIILKHLNNISGTFLTECLSKQPLSKLSKCNFALLSRACYVWCIYLVVKKRKKTYCLACIHVPKMNISKSWQWNQRLKETKSNRICHKCLNLLLATRSSLQLKY